MYQEKKVWHNIDVTLKRCKRLKCDVCKEPHAPLGCQRMGCRKTFHQPCAIKANCVFDEEKFLISCFVCDEVMKAREKKREKLEAEKKAKKEAAMKAKSKKRRQKKQKKKSKGTKKRKALATRPHNRPEVIEGEEDCVSSEEEEVEEVETVPSSPVTKINPLLLRLRPVVSDLFKRLRKDDLPVQKIHDALTEFDTAMGRQKTSRADLDDALRELENENRVMYREYDGAWTVFLI